MYKRYSFLLLALLLLSACASDFEKAMESTDKALRYKVGTQYYESGQYDKAAQLLESIRRAYARSPQAERVDYLTADAYFKKGDYELAAYYFKRFYKTFPQSGKAHLATYQTAVCYDVQSPDFQLDQFITKDAIQAYQFFINTYPNSDKVAEADARIRALTEKLEKKQFAIAKLYFKTLNYRAAKVAIENFLDDYPDTDLRREAMEKLFEASYQLAINSVFKLKEERLIEAQTAYRLLIQAFPNTSLREEADSKKQEIDRALAGVRKRQAALQRASASQLQNATHKT